MRTHIPSVLPKRSHAMRLGLCLWMSLLLAVLLLATLSTAFAFDEENGLPFYDPLDSRFSISTDNSDTVSSLHFDLVGALAVAAGFSAEDAATIQIYSQLTDKSVLPAQAPQYQFDANPANYPAAPDLSTVTPDQHCPSPSTTAPQVMMGAAGDLMECPGCFTSRLGPYAVFFHFPRTHDLAQIEDWAYNRTPQLHGSIIYGYSSTVSTFSVLPPEVYTATNIANVYKATACFVERPVQAIDTGSVKAGSLEAFGVYLHALGDAWSHQECIDLTVKQRGYLFAAHVYDPQDAELTAACGWLSHSEEFGNPAVHPESQRTYTATLEIYEAIVAYGAASGRTHYKPIGLTDFNAYLDSHLQTFAQMPTSLPRTRRVLAAEIKNWAKAVQTADPRYWRNTITVCASGCDHATVNSALGAATAGQSVAVWPGTYTETVTLKAGVKLYGVPLLTILNGNGSGPVVTASGSAILSDTVLSGFVVSGGMAANGAGILVDGGAAPTLTGLVVRSNKASDNGGGLYVTGNSAPRLLLSTFYSNTARSGAGIFIDGAPAWIEGVAFQLNAATTDGGAVTLQNSSATVRNSSFVANVAGAAGGAIFVNGGNPTVESNLIAGFNSAVESGGGIAVDGGGAQIQHNQIISNTAGIRGGGVALRNGATPTVHNNLVINNRAGVSGAGINIRSAAGTLRNNTISHNSGLGSDGGDGIFLSQELGGTATTPTILNNIIAFNQYGVRAQDVGQFKPSPTVHHNDLWSNSGGNLIGANVAGQAADNLNADPLFVVGMVGNFYLSHSAAGQGADSPAMNAGAGTAASLGLQTRTTRTDNVTDADAVDLGFHACAVPTLTQLISHLSGGEMTYAEGLTITVKMPAEALRGSILLSIGVAEGHPAPARSTLMGSGFSITAHTLDGQPVTEFQQPFTLTISTARVDHQDFHNTKLVFWNETAGRWQEVPSRYDEVNGKLIATLDHLTDFAVVQSTSYPIYLPSIVR